jgi:hypothetical protein
MVKFFSLKCGELGLEFIENEIISLKPVFVVENKRVAKVHDVRN